jgi:hypothetical protein
MLAFMAATAWLAAASGQTYGNMLLTRELSRDRHLVYASIDLDGPSNGHFEGGSKQKGAQTGTFALADGLGEKIGTLTLEFAQRVSPTAATRVVTDISRHVYSKAVLAEPDPFVSGAFRSAEGSRLIERELGREARLVTIAFHVALPGSDNRIIASNFGRIGKAADADDQRVIETSTILQEVTNNGKRLAVELPLLDRSGRTIGALSTSFIISPGGREAAYQSALRVQHEISHSIPGVESLARESGK